MLTTANNTSLNEWNAYAIIAREEGKMYDKTKFECIGMKMVITESFYAIAYSPTSLVQKLFLSPTKRLVKVHYTLYLDETISHL